MKWLQIQTQWLFAVMMLVLSNLAVADSANQADAWQAIRSGALLIDVRRPAEFASGHIDGAINIPVDQIAARIAEVASDKQRSIVVYCLGGMRSASAQQILHGIGYSKVIDGGGYEAMKAAEPK